MDFEVFDEEVDGQPELEFDVENTTVQVIDGVVISNDDEQLKLLFYYILPGENLDNSNSIQCKGVAEFRISRSKFLDIAKSIKEKARELNKYQRRLSDFMFA